MFVAKTCWGIERFKIWLIRAIIRANSSGASLPSSAPGNSLSYLQLSPNMVTSPIPFSTMDGFVSLVSNDVYLVADDAYHLPPSDLMNLNSPILQFRPFTFFISLSDTVCVFGWAINQKKLSLTLSVRLSPEDNCSKKRAGRLAETAHFSTHHNTFSTRPSLNFHMPLTI